LKFETPEKTPETKTLVNIQSETPSFSAKPDECNSLQHAIDPQESLINGDLNDLLDRELKPMNDDIDPWGKREKIQQKGGSTHVSSLHKSPLDAYTDHQSGHAFTCQPSQRSSFDDSFSETFNPFLSLNGTCINPISVSFVGEGLFKPEQDEEVEEATDIETTLIQ
jgi:hypothetical protein